MKGWGRSFGGLVGSEFSEDIGSLALPTFLLPLKGGATRQASGLAL